MAAPGVFSIAEFRNTGGVFTENPDGEIFEWTAPKRSIPKRPWHIPGKLRTVRTDYPGAKKPSVQVLGPVVGQSTLEGRWDDRYNSAGFALAERQRFVEMCERGNPVRITFDQEMYDCLIIEWNCEYHRREYIPYSFVIDNHGRPGNDLTDRSPRTVASAVHSYASVNVVAQIALDTHGKMAPQGATSSVRKDVDGFLSTAAANMDKLADMIDTRSGVLKPVDEFKKTATMFRIVGGSASDVINRLIAVRSDVELGVRTAMSVLNFEAWSRGLRSQLRLLLGESNKAAGYMDERSQPKAVGHYRPRAGESLYSISRRFYGTPFAWRLIADRNGLSTLRLNGTEDLIIPERGVG